MERYEQVEKRSYNTFDPITPVHVVASALLRDNTSFSYLAQLKLRNDSEFELENVTVVVIPLDESNNKIGKEISHNYERLTVSPGKEFGSEEALVLPDIQDIRSFHVTVKKIVFKNGLEWEIGQRLEEIKAAKIDDILGIINCKLDNHNYQVALNQVNYIPDNGAEKESIIRMIYFRCIDDAHSMIADNSFDEATKVLRLVPNGFEGKEKCMSSLDAAKYNKAISDLKRGELKSAKALFTSLGNYKDSREQISQINRQSEQNKKHLTKITVIVIVVLIVIACTGFGIHSYIENKAEQRARQAELREKKAEQRAKEQAELEFQNNTKRMKPAIKEALKSVTTGIGSGSEYTVGMKSNGTVVAYGDNYFGQLNVKDWKNIIAISVRDYQTVGLKSNGTVVSCGSARFGNLQTDDWSDIIAISAGYDHTVGLRSNGTVVGCGDNDNGAIEVDDWKDIVAISAGGTTTCGLKTDGTVVACGSNEYGELEANGWTNIVAISAGSGHIVGLKTDGTVVACGANDMGQLDVNDWEDIIAISAGHDYTVGLKSNGTVVAVGWNHFGQTKVNGWKDIVAISAGYDHTVGLKSDGTIVTCGAYDREKSVIKKWKKAVSKWDKIVNKGYKYLSR